MKRPKADSEPQAVVIAFDDHEVIVPPHRLKKKVTRRGENVPYSDPVACAEKALSELAGDFAHWMEKECERLDAARRKVKKVGFDERSRDELFRAAHDIKGEAATFGFPLIEPLAASLCRLIEHTPEPARIPLLLVDQHVDGVRAVLHRNARGNTEKTARQLAQRLRVVTEEFLVNANLHRPGYLDEAPPLAPGETLA